MNAVIKSGCRLQIDGSYTSRRHCRTGSTLHECNNKASYTNSPRRPRFDPGSVHVGFVVDKVALGRGFPRVLRFSPVNFIPPVPHYKEKQKKLLSSSQDCTVSLQGYGASVASAAGPSPPPPKKIYKTEWQEHFEATPKSLKSKLLAQYTDKDE
jgi:hypothetical protein